MIRPVCASSCLLLSMVLSGRPAAAQTAPDGPILPTTVPVSAEPATAAERGSTVEQRMPSFKDLYVPLPGDFRRLATGQNLSVAAVGLGAALASHPADARLAGAPWASNGPNSFFRPGEQAGGLALHAAGGFAAFLVGRATSNTRLATVGAEVFRAQIVAQTTTHAVKFTAHRTRPDGTTSSFPSGHASSLFATATVLQRDLGWKVGAPAYAIAAWVGASRVENRRHYLSDVLAGATIGILAGRSVTVGSGAARFAISPMAANGGIGVNFTKIGK